MGARGKQEAAEAEVRPEGVKNHTFCFKSDPARCARGSLGEKNNFGYPQGMKERMADPIPSAEKWGLSPLSSHRQLWPCLL